MKSFTVQHLKFILEIYGITSDYYCKFSYMEQTGIIRPLLVVYTLSYRYAELEQMLRQLLPDCDVRCLVTSDYMIDRLKSFDFSDSNVVKSIYKLKNGQMRFTNYDMKSGKFNTSYNHVLFKYLLSKYKESK